MNVNREQLVAAAKELNEVLGLEPAIETAIGEKELIEAVVEASELIQPEDDITADTQAVIAALKGEDTPAEAEDAKADEDAAEEKPAKGKAKGGKAKAKAKPAKEKKEKAPKGPGVIATIVEVIENAGKEGVSKEQILDILEERFPDRSRESMAKTVNVQVPTRISKERFKVEKTEAGLYRKA